MKKAYSRYSLFVAVLSFITGSAQQHPSLPKGLTAAETELVTSYNFRTNRRTAPPATAVRTMAEWEEAEYLVITWDPYYKNILRQIVAAAINECKVIITTQEQATVSAYLTQNGIALTNIIFLNAPWDSIWTRDYSANTIYSNDVGTRALTDWIYNRPRPQDDVMPTAQAALTEIPLYITGSGLNDLVNTGGNFMSDGLGTAFASELILEENAPGNPYGVTAKTEGQVNGIMQSYMGIDNYIKMPVLPYDGIHHIDMHMKLLDEETLLVSRYPAGVADGPYIESNIQEVLQNHMSVFGTPYRVKWIDAPPGPDGDYPDTGGAYRTYSNSVIINKTILVPVYRPETDAAALAAYQELMPGYTIVGIDVDNDGENLINSSGAIHCITHTIGVAEPLLIVHQPVREAAPGATVQIKAMVKHVSGIASAKVLWRNQGTIAFTETPMIMESDNNWAANITANTNGNDIEYYITAQANSGKTVTRPLTAPQGYWIIKTDMLGMQQQPDKIITAAWPNPTHNTINFNLNYTGPLQITIHNIVGQLLYTNSLTGANKTIALNLNSEWNGTLFITFEGSFGKVVKKVIKM